MALRLFLFPKLILSQEQIDVVILHNVSQSYTDRSIRSLLKKLFVNTKHIQRTRYFDQYFVSPKHSTKCSYVVLMRSRQYNN